MEKKNAVYNRICIVMAVMIVFVLAIYLVEMYQVGVLGRDLVRNTSNWPGRSAMCLLTLFILFIQTIRLMENIIKSRLLANLVGITYLFLLLALRVPEDTFHPYMWLEDGVVLIQGAMDEGLVFILHSNMGTFWVIQKTLAWVIYRFFTLFGNLSLVPIVLGWSSKFIAGCGIFYFMGERFSWMVEERAWRFGICGMVVLMIPMNGHELLPVDTSMPFLLLFFVYLFGMRYLCAGAGAGRQPDWGETLACTVIALSSAAAIVVAFVFVTAMIYCLVRNNIPVDGRRKAILVGLLKMTLPVISAMIQLREILLSGRAGTEWELGKRLLYNTQKFISLPYWQKAENWVLFFVGILFWVLVIYMTHMPYRIWLYSAGFSYLYLLYCSMSHTPEGFYYKDMDGWITGRFSTTSMQIAGFMMAYAGYLFFKKKKNNARLYGGLSVSILVTMMMVAIPTYYVDQGGGEYFEGFKRGSIVFSENGSDKVLIAVAPWDLFQMHIPAELSGKKCVDDMRLYLTRVNDKPYRNGGMAEIETAMVLEGRVSTADGKKMRSLFFKNNDGAYNAVFSIDKNQWCFHMTQEELTEEMTEVEFIGITEDGKYHRGVLAL